MRVREKSPQAQEDLALVTILKDENSSSREKDKAFNSLYAKHEKQILFFLKRNIRNIETAEDLRMVTFQKVYENIQKFNEEEGAFSTWIYSIAKNALIDNERKQKFEVISIDAMSEKALDNGFSEPYQIESSFETPEEEIISLEEEQSVMKAINSLDGKILQELATNRFVHGMSFKEIAETMGLEETSTMRVKILRAKNVLQQVLKNE